MKIGISLSWPQQAEAIGPEVARLARVADDAGVDSMWTMDHLFQIPVTKLPREAPMLEGYALLAYVAGQTQRIHLGTMVTCPVYRHPGVLIKSLTTLDVLSGGRFVFGVGVGWDVEEATALGIPFPALGERFERLEEVLQLARQMWAGDESPFVGRHYQLPRPMNSPGSLLPSGPPILIAGGGERRTLRLVAEYGDACNLFDLPAPYSVDIRRKLDVLRSHCVDVGREYTDIEKTTITGFDLGDNTLSGQRDLVGHLTDLAALGVDHVILNGPRFEWGPELDAVIGIIDEIHAIEPDRSAA